jgi:RNA polymerase sigma-70 factor (ECF subfamily)
LGLLLRAARFEVRRRRGQLSWSSPAELDELAQDAAGDALVSVLARLDDFRGASRFTTWVYKFALLEAAVKVRRRAWRAREVPQESERWAAFESSGLGPDGRAEQSELVRAIQSGIDRALTTHQRAVLVALALNEVPIDVLAERLETTRGALYKSLHDARKRLRQHLLERGFDVSASTSEGGNRVSA